MKITKINPKKALNKAFLKQRPLRSEIELFKTNLIALLDKISIIEKQPKDETEEHLKNNLRDFLRDTYYKDTNAINTKDKKDLVIHLAKTTDSSVGVVIEAKRPTNINEMLSAENPNRKALHELILYYLEERNNADNIELKHLIITNIYEWYIIDANYFDKHIYRNTQIKKLYDTKINDKKDNPFFYEQIAKLIDKIDLEIPCTHFDIRSYEKELRNDKLDDDKKLIALYKLLSPYHLLKVPFANDSNSLNEKFYKELLHIIGLEEVKVGTKNIIQRREKDKQAGSFIENVINILITEDPLHKIKDRTIYGQTRDEQLYNIALELSLTWINRILFLKLLEGQLITYHKGNKDYRFFNFDMIHDYDELYKLFHQVLARNMDERAAAIKQKYARVPYLNSSLFEISELEDVTIKINSLDNADTIELINTTVLKEEKKKNTKLPSLEYLFKFLDAYDFASEGGEDIAEDSKTIINASVLGKVFEKINGYKDGSIFTPGFITMYMSRQSIRLAVTQKFNEYFKTKEIAEVSSFDELYNRIDKIDIKTANDTINSLRICDPAVGSGHFLVSVLNEMIAIKSELGILADKNGKRIRDYEIVVDNDELYISDENGIFEYNYQNKESQRVQETIFNERQTIIENCLFGVDINPNSVKICRLRLWIELLKSSYYKSPNYTELETLPNIDINIKCGNSLISRYALDADLKKALQKSKWNISMYRMTVMTYRNAKSKDEKRAMEKLIDEIKNNFETEIQLNDKRFKKLRDLQGELFTLTNQGVLFDKSPKEKADWNKRVAELTAAIKKQEEIIEEIKSNVIYKNAFEWRFEFPEVLNDDGDFEGFDVVIGNPPYGAEIPNREILKELFPSTSNGQIDTYKYFIELCLKIIKTIGISTYITSDSYLEKKYFKDVRVLLVKNSLTIRNIKLGDDIFEDINLPTAIFQIRKGYDTKLFEYKDISSQVNNFNKTILLNNDFDYNVAIPDFERSFKIKTSITNDVNCKKLIEIFDQVMGVKVYQVGKGKPKQTEYEINNNVFISNEKTGIDYYKFISQGIERYNYKSQGEWIKYGEWLAEPRQLKYFTNPKLVIREIVNPRIFATYIEEEAVVKNIAAVIIKKDNSFELKYLLALLNSNLFTYYLFEQTPKSTNKSYPSFTSELIKNLPIKNITVQDQQPFIDLVDKIISQKQQGQDTTELEKRIDDLVYELYGLTEEEIKIVEEKND